MPVVPAMVAIGSALGASAATAATVGTIATITTGAVVMKGVSMYKSHGANKASANLARATANYNARVGEQNAKQVEYDALENTRIAREEASVYTSRQTAAYAASGVLISGSPLAVMASSVGRMEQKIQQDRINSDREARKIRSAAAVGRMYGEATAVGIMKQDQAEMLSGGASILSTIGSAYLSGSIGAKSAAPIGAKSAAPVGAKSAAPVGAKV